MCCCINDPKDVARHIVRIGLGLALAFVGFSHYQDPQFAAQVGLGLGILSPLGVVWGYVLPGLMIFGGVLLAFGIYLNIAAYSVGIALASIPAGMALKSAIGGIPLEDTMPAITNALVWAIVLLLSLKGNCCADMPAASKPVAKPAAVPAPKPALKPAPKSVPAPVKSIPPVATATLKTPPKKAPAKKSVPAKKVLPAAGKME